ncbi:Uncharacterised protein [Mycobacteroides abscessus subsp. abscessus]|nr:Uncharacterised protein [Mycobacteroides abscessus subsp. abscessus]
MNCMGPIARSWFASPSSAPLSVSGSRRFPLDPSSRTPRIGGSASPLGCSSAP